MDRTHIVVMNEAHRMNSDQTPVKVTLYRWAGSWGPFKVNIPCGECSLTVAIIAAHVQRSSREGSHIFGKEMCPHCVRAKAYLNNANIEYTYHDVVKEPRALYEMLGRVKPIVGPKTPITVPQIWVDGSHVGGADELEVIVKSSVEPNPDRGHSSMSAATRRAS